MNLKKLKKIWLSCLILAWVFGFSLHIYAQNNDLQVDWFNIIPELSDSQLNEAENAIVEVWKNWWKVMDTYREKADELSTSQQLATWIMNRDTIMDYLVFIVKFLSQLGLTIWAWFIIYAGYKYMTSVFNWWKTSPDMVKNAIIWILIVIFSYAIMKTFTSIAWLS